jgi:hypothetical protein
MPIFLTGRRSATTTLAQMHAYDLNLCTDLHCSRRTLTLAAPCSCAATSSTNALIGVGCHQPVRLPRANPHSARRTTACHFPRFRSLKAFGRRPRCTPRRRDRPASETLNISAATDSANELAISRPITPSRAVERCAQGSGWGWRDRGTGLAVLSEDRGVNNLGSDRSIP